MMMTTMMCDFWQLIALLCNCKVSKDSGFIVTLEGLMVDLTLMASKDAGWMKQTRELHCGLNDCIHPTCSKRTGRQVRMEPRSTA